jgi:hypothetical protein
MKRLRYNRPTPFASAKFGIAERSSERPGQLGALPSGIVEQSALFGHYERQIGRDPAYGVLLDRTGRGIERTEAQEREELERRRAGEEAARVSEQPARQAASVIDSSGKGAARPIGSGLARSYVRGVLGGRARPPAGISGALSGSLPRSPSRADGDQGVVRGELIHGTG